MITFGDNGQEIDRGNQTYTVRVRGETYKRVLKDGFIYQMNHPIKKAGAYQLRAAVRDAGSGKAGSASQFIEVPDVTKGKLVLSGIVLKERDPSMPGPAPAPGHSNGSGNAAPPPGAPAQAATKQAPAATQQAGDDDARGGPALRIFTPGKLLTYGVQVINAKADGGKQPAVDTQLHLYRDGKEMYVGKPIPVQSTEQPDLKRLVTGGYLRLGTAMGPATTSCRSSPPTVTPPARTTPRRSGSISKSRRRTSKNRGQTERFQVLRETVLPCSVPSGRVRQLCRCRSAHGLSRGRGLGDRLPPANPEESWRT